MEILDFEIFRLSNKAWTLMREKNKEDGKTKKIRLEDRLNHWESHRMAIVLPNVQV